MLMSWLPCGSLSLFSVTNNFTEWSTTTSKCSFYFFVCRLSLHFPRLITITESQPSLWHAEMSLFLPVETLTVTRENQHTGLLTTAPVTSLPSTTLPGLLKLSKFLCIHTHARIECSCAQVLPIEFIWSIKPVWDANNCRRKRTVEPVAYRASQLSSPAESLVRFSVSAQSDYKW